MNNDTERDDERDIDALLEHLDHPVPRVSVDTIVARAHGHAHAGARVRRWSTVSRAAAAILLALTVGGVAWAIPGSPVRRWVSALISRIAPPSAPVVPVVAPAPRVPERSGVAVAPGRALVIRFAERQASGVIRVTLTDSADVSVVAEGGEASFTAGNERLDVGNRGSSASFDVRIPRGAPSVDIEVGGVRVFTKRDAGINLPRDAEPGGVYVIPLTAAGR